MVFLLSAICMLILGLWAIAPLWADKCPKATECFAKCARFRETLAFIGVVLGVFLLYQGLVIAVISDGLPWIPLLMLASAAILIVQSIAAGKSILADKILAGFANARARVEGWHVSLAPREQQLGLAGVALGGLSIIVLLWKWLL